MIQQETELEIADNSGAKLVKCIKVLGGTRRRYAKAGDVIVASVREVAPGSSVEKGSVVKVLIVRTSAPIRRPDGSVLRFDRNAGIVLGDKGEPKGTRVFGPIAREVRDENLKVASMAIEVI